MNRYQKTALKWWLRVFGVLYVLCFLAGLAVGYWSA